MQDFQYLNLLGEQGGQIDSSRDHWVRLCLLVLGARWFETYFGWVLAGGSTEACSTESSSEVATCHATEDDLLQKFWEIEDAPLSEPALNPEERSAIQHFKTNQTRNGFGRFIVPLPRRENVKFIKDPSW